MTVNTERIEKLTAALRSGQYKQGKSMLRNWNNDTYCCLGVACEVYRQETGDGVWQQKYPGDGPLSSSYTYFLPEADPRLGRDLEMPAKVAAWYGFDFGTPLVKLEDDVQPIRPLTWVNDDLGRTFEEIADLIEANFLPRGE